MLLDQVYLSINSLMVVPQIELSLGSSKAAGPNTSLQSPNIYLCYKVGPGNKYASHPVKT